MRVLRVYQSCEFWVWIQNFCGVTYTCFVRTYMSPTNRLTSARGIQKNIASKGAWTPDLWSHRHSSYHYTSKDWCWMTTCNFYFYRKCLIGGLKIGWFFQFDISWLPILWFKMVISLRVLRVYQPMEFCLVLLWRIYCSRGPEFNGKQSNLRYLET